MEVMLSVVNRILVGAYGEAPLQGLSLVQTCACDLANAQPRLPYILGFIVTGIRR